MVYISPEICYIIWQYGGNNARILNKELNDYITLERNKFKTSPLVLEYRLAKYRTRGYEDEELIHSTFPRIKVGEYKTIELNGIIPLGTITKNTIIPSQPLLNNIIPKKEEIFYWGSFPSLPASKMTFYWELFNILPKSINRCKQYKLLFN